MLILYNKLIKTDFYQSVETLFYEGIDSHSTYFITPIFNKYKLTKYFKLILVVMIDDCVQFSGAIHGIFQISFAICHLS